VVDLVHLLDLEEVIAGAEAAELAAPTLARLLGQGVRIATVEASMRLDAREVVTARPPRTPLGDTTELRRGQRHTAPRAHAGGYRRVEGVEEALEARRHVRRGQPRAHEAHAAVDVVADTARAHDATLRRIRGDYPADRKPVALMDVGHGERSAHDAG